VPTWLAILLAVLSIPLIGTVLTLLWQRELEKRRLVAEASAVITPLQELLRDLVVNTRRVDEWPQLRNDLLVYANKHPRARVRSLARELVETVDSELRFAVEALQFPEQPAAAALAKSEELMQEVRRD
jgi:hypothetical protein